MLEDATIDWAMGETLAYGSLLLEGRPVRLAGQDARRGTFGHRHAVIVDRATGGEHTPLANLSPDQAPFYVYDSLLSSSPRWASSTATRWPGRTRWCCGRRSSATSSTAP
jgi:2-oxoglutarate dehydrogenase complex dehydrogenase (E1) component-like enzyme